MNTLKSLFLREIAFFKASPAIAWHLLFFYIPVLLIFILSFLDKSTQSFGITTTHYEYFLNPLFLWIIVRSLTLAFFTALICLFFAYPLAYCLAVKIQRYKNFFLFFLLLPFWTSLMVQVYAWFFVLEHNGLLNTLLLKFHLIRTPLHLLNTPFAVYTVMAYCYLPFMILPLYTVLEKINPNMFEAAADLGATQWQTFWQVTIPLSMSGIKTGFFLVFVPSFGEFVVPMLLGGGKKMYVGSLITQYFLFARNPYHGAAFTVISSIALVSAVGVIYLYFKRKVLILLPRKGV